VGEGPNLAALLAQALGITASTAVRWSQLAGRTYNGYVDRVVRGQALNYDREGLSDPRTSIPS
jgi:hypothetical protein